MGRRGGIQAAFNRDELLSRTREMLYVAAPQAAGLLADIVDGKRKASPVERQAAADILDRTVGRLQLEVDASGSDLATEIVRSLADVDLEVRPPHGDG
jgi:hypothetical protein